MSTDLRMIVREGAARFDTKPLYRASIAARAELHAKQLEEYDWSPPDGGLCVYDDGTDLVRVHPVVQPIKGTADYHARRHTYFEDLKWYLAKQGPLTVSNYNNNQESYDE